MLKQANESVGPHRIYPVALKELVDVTTKLWCLKSHSDWKKANITPIFKKHKKEDSVKERLSNLTSVLWEIMDQSPLGGTSKDTNNSEVLKNSWQRFSTQIMPDLQIDFYSKEDWLDRWGESSLLDFTKAFDKVYILVARATLARA